MTHSRLHRYLGVALLLTLFVSTRCPAQTPIDPGKLPGRTLFYLCWHGSPSGAVRSSNSLYALWDDPDFAPARASLFNALVTDNSTQGKPPMSREELQQYVTLLDNPFLVGYIRQPESHNAPKTLASTTKTTSTSKAPAPAPPAWDGIFLIYDRSGKEALLSKAVLQMRAAEKDIPKLTELTVAGVPSLKVERKSGITYWAEFGKYAVSASELSVFEEILNVVNGKPAATSLSQSSSYQEASRLLNGGVLEFFLLIPRPDQVDVDSSNPMVNQLKPLVSALKLESIHSIAGRVTLEGSKSRLTGAILGDTAPGGLFDLWGDGQTNPVSMGYLPPDTVQYGESEFNLLGIYNTLKRAFSSIGTTQAANTNAIEQMAATRLGMPVPDALNVVTGEIAWIQTSPTLDDSPKVFLFGLRSKPDALKLTRSIMGDQVTSERNEGNTTFLKISLHGGQSSAGLAQWNFYYLAMTPNLLFGASKSDTIRKYATQTPADPDAAQLKNLLAARAQLPQKLNGFSYFDFQRVDWPGLQAKWVADAKKAAQTAKSTDASNSSKKMADWLTQVNPEVFSRHLHAMSGGSWKDATGVHFDHWLD
jgi:hypothetical protein